MRTIRNSQPRKNKLSERADAMTANAVSWLYQLLPTFGATIATITAIGYIVGWNMLKSYYSELGAEWYAKTLPTSRVIQECEPVLVILVLSIIFGVLSLMRGANTRRMEWYVIIPALIAAVLGVSLAFLESKFSVEMAYHLAVLSGACFTTSAGFTIAEMISRLRDSRLAWTPAHLSLLLTVYSYGMVQGPLAIANSKARFDMNPATSTLAHVVKKGCNSCIWRLVDVIDNKAFLARISPDKADRVFLLVSLDENWEIGR